MKKSPKRKNRKLVDLHMYGIFDNKNNAVTKISLDQMEIDMEIALIGDLKENLVKCEFDIKLVI